MQQLDPALAALLAEAPAPDVQSVSISDLRAQAEQSVLSLGAGAPDVHAATEVSVPGPAGDVALRAGVTVLL